MKSTRHVDIKTQAVAPESGVKPVVPCGARLEAPWATSIPEPDIVVAFPLETVSPGVFRLLFSVKCIGIFPRKK